METFLLPLFKPEYKVVFTDVQQSVWELDSLYSGDKNFVPKELLEKIVDNNWMSDKDKLRPVVNVVKKYKNYNLELNCGIQWFNYVQNSFETLSDKQFVEISKL